MVREALQGHTQTLVLVPYSKEIIGKTSRSRFLSKTPKYPNMPCSFGSRECYGPWIQGWTEPALISSLISRSHYPKPTSIFTQILYREGCTNQDISLLLSAPSHLWLLFPLAQILAAEEQGSTAAQALTTLFSPMSTEWECLIWRVALRSKC